MGKRKPEAQTHKVKYYNEEFEVPVILPHSQPSDEDILLVGGLILTIYANRTHSLTQLAKLFGVNRNMVYRWLEKFEQLNDLFQKAKLRRKEKYSENVTELAMTSAERLLSTKYYVKRRITYKVKNVSGEQMMKLYNGELLSDLERYDLEISEVIEPHKANAQITLAVLYNRMRDEWTKNPEPIRQEAEQEHIPLAKWVDDEAEDPETDEIKALLDDDGE